MAVKVTSSGGTWPKHKFEPGERSAAQAYQQGYSAARNPHDSASRCPYAEGTPEHEAWRNGFADASDEHIPPDGF